MDSTDGRIVRAPARRKRNDEQLVDRVSTQIYHISFSHLFQVLVKLLFNRT